MRAKWPPVLSEEELSEILQDTKPLEGVTYLCQAELKQRGWTPSMIWRLLGKPDARQENPIDSYLAPMKLYIKVRVLHAEPLPAFEKGKKRSRVLRERVMAHLSYE